MDFSVLPYLPAPVRGESKQSWMTALSLRQPLDIKDWWEMVAASPTEPERPHRNSHWIGLPEQLGDISRIAPAWRLCPRQRRVYCPHCVALEEEQRRWPTLISWLDARRLVCQEHGCPLVYLNPIIGSDPGHKKCQSHPELLELYAWTQQWLRIELAPRRKLQLESQWRRDLVRLMHRNWTPARCHSAAGVGAWELWQMGWYGQEKGGQFDAGGPGRLGELSAPERLGSLLLAHRAWRCFRFQPATIPRLPRIAWEWLALRWQRRLHGTQRARFIAVAENLMKNA